MYNIELAFDVYKNGDEIIFENYDNESGREISYSVSPEDLFEAMIELEREYGRKYDVVFRVQE